MTMRRSRLLLFGLSLVAVVGFALVSQRIASAQRASLAAMTRDADALERGIAQQQARSQDMASRPGQAQAGPGPVHDPARRQAAPAAARSASNLQDLVANNPKLRDLVMQAVQANLVERYGRLYRKMGLTPDQIHKFEQLAAANSDDQKSLYAAGHAQGMTNDDAGLEDYRQTMMQEYYAALAQQISPAFSQEVEQADRERSREGAFQTVMAVANRGMMPVEAAMTFEQIDQYTQLVERNSPEFSAGGTIDLDKVDWQSVAAQAATFLSPDQLRGLQAAVQQSQLSARLQQFYSQTPPPK